ncbi:MAG: discoidin domain-containing protein [Armatimonadetes bacterium]|nr:discoidin domain-containing protein [Armatimonadota bacterium]
MPCSALVLGALAPASAQPPSAPHPPIPVHFTLAKPGYVTLIIEDAQGKRVRNLVSETKFAAGANTVWWDGLDDLGRDPDAARHGVYSVPGRMVPAGTYRVRGLTHGQLAVRYVMTPYTHGRPPWNNGRRDSEWLANHTPPQGVVWVPQRDADQGAGGASPGGKILVGSYVTEGGNGLAWLDMSGRKRYGQMWLGGVWTGAPFLAYDAGAHPVPGTYAYTASAWDNELRLHAMMTLASKASGPRDTRFGYGDDRPVLTPTWKFPGAGGAWNATSDLAAVSGLAVRDGLLVAALPKLNELLFVDARAQRALGTASLPDPRGLAFDAQGRLLALSGRTLLRYKLPADLTAALYTGPSNGNQLSADGWTATARDNAKDAPLALDGNGDTRWSTNAPQTPGQWYQVDMGHPRTFTYLVLHGSKNAPDNYPRGYEVSVSEDGQNWGRPLATGRGTQADTVIAVPRTTARYVRITQTDREPAHVWSINDLEIYDNPSHALPGGETVVAQGLEDPQGLALDAQGNIYLSDQGASHQVKVFAPNGRFLRAIGHPGAPKAGSYDPMHMNHPAGITIDGQGRLWVTENDFQPKRVSVWDARTGALLQAFYGPPIYGGGGQLDPHDPTLFRYMGMAFRLDPKTGDSRPIDVFYRRRDDDPLLGSDWAPFPQTALYAHGRTYLTNCFNVSATNGADYALLWQMQSDGTARAVAALGRANAWPLLKTAPFRGRWPQGVNPDGGDWWYGEGMAHNGTLFIWSDLNGDGRVQPAEVRFLKAATGQVTVTPDLSFVDSRVDGKATRYAPVRFTPRGVPVYDLARGQALTSGTQDPLSTGGDQALVCRDGWTVQYPPSQPFSAMSLGGSHHGTPVWSYPNLWPGLHASHDAPMPDRPGEVIGATRLLGQTATPKGSDAGEIWAINGNKGNVYLFTTDGLFVATLFQDCRLKAWDAPQAVPGMDMNGYSLQEESFWPSMTQTTDGRIYLVGNSSVLRLEGLESAHRLPAQTLTITPPMLAAAHSYFVQQEQARQQAQARAEKPLTVALRADAPTVDGKLDEWPKEAFVPIDNHTSAALAVSGDRLYAAFQTGDAGLLNNSPEALQNLFKTGGALDIMLEAIPGGERLLVTQVSGKTAAVLYRPHVPGTTTEPVKFVSMLGINKTVTMDRVDDVSDQVMLAGDGQGNYEFSVPLSLLSFSSQPGRTLNGDVGILRGNGHQTLQRVYWHNKSTGLVSDLASEAELTPQLWGTFTLDVDAPMEGKGTRQEKRAPQAAPLQFRCSAPGHRASPGSRTALPPTQPVDEKMFLIIGQDQGRQPGLFGHIAGVGQGHLDDQIAARLHPAGESARIAGLGEAGQAARSLSVDAAVGVRRQVMNQVQRVREMAAGQERPPVPICLAAIVTQIAPLRQPHCYWFL